VYRAKGSPKSAPPPLPLSTNPMIKDIDLLLSRGVSGGGGGGNEKGDSFTTSSSSLSFSNSKSGDFDGPTMKPARKKSFV
jgi:hypothetical protein